MTALRTAVRNKYSFQSLGSQRFIIIIIIIITIIIIIIIIITG